MVVMVTRAIKKFFINIASPIWLIWFVVIRQTNTIKIICRKVLILLINIGFKLNFRLRANLNKYAPDIRTSLDTIKIIKYSGNSSLMPKIK